MRASPDTIRQAILHPEAFVRQRALDYFTKSFSDDPAVTTVAIEALARYGRSRAFLFANMDDWPCTEGALDWALAELQRPWEGTASEQGTYFRGLSRFLAGADLSLLGPRAAEALRNPAMEEKARTALQDRLRLANWDETACWDEIDRFCRSKTQPRFIDIEEDDGWRHAERVVEVLSRLGPRQGERALAILMGPKRNYPPPAYTWLLPLLIELVGRQRVPDAFTPLLAFLLDGFDVWGVPSMHALARIGTPEIIGAIRAVFSGADRSFRINVTEVLERIHLDDTVTALLALLAATRNSDEQTFLHHALQGQFSEEGVEPTRRFLLGETLDNERRDLRVHLVAVCTVQGARFPEYEAWFDKARQDEELQAQGVRKMETLLHEAGGDMRRMIENMKASQRPAPGPVLPSLGTSPIRHPRPAAPRKVGRNDPCPCGSGKKFKNCCLNRDV
jgi:hypothetical protein